MESGMEPPAKKGFWGGLLRRASLVKKPITKRDSRRASFGDAGIRRERRRSMDGQPPRQQQQQQRVRSRHLAPQPAEPAPEEPQDSQWETEPDLPRSRKSRGKLPEDTNGHRTPSPAPLTRWPPSGMSVQEDMTPLQATQLICNGAPLYQGHKRLIPHASEDYFYSYSTTTGSRGGGDGAGIYDSMVHLMTMQLQTMDPAKNPWDTLEQPSYAFHYGKQVGTVTLNRWASTASSYPPSIALRDSGVTPRSMTIDRIFDRLQELRGGLEDDDPVLLYKILYRRILRDPDRILNPHKTLDKQITDLILALSRPSWIDFSNPRNHVVARFIFGKGQDDFEHQYEKFFHQLLLALELELRIQSSQHDDWAKEKLLETMPPSIKWNLALARRWKQYVRVEDFGKTPDQIKLRYKLKKRQVRLLKRFAQTMKWPNLGETMEHLKQKDEDFALDTISSDAFGFFSGLVLPGPTLPFLIMNTLIDLDPDPATDELALLSHMHPQCGFQYRNSYTYWSASSIVGKVLAPTCQTLAGWVGPARPTPDLSRSQIARIRSRQPKQRLRAEDVESMAARSEPLGPPADCYPAQDYLLDMPDADDVIDTIRVEMLGLRPAVTAVGANETLSEPRTFDATVQFAIDGLSWPLRLMYDVAFISSYPCTSGPHPLFFDYIYKRVRVDEIVAVRNWGGIYGQDQQNQQQQTNGNRENEEEEVLVVEAFGVRDNEVLARAWCAHWGLSAIVADLRRTCLACAVREAYAATLTVVIIIDRQEVYDEGE